MSTAVPLSVAAPYDLGDAAGPRLVPHARGMHSIGPEPSPMRARHLGPLEDAEIAPCPRLLGQHPVETPVARATHRRAHDVGPHHAAALARNPHGRPDGAAEGS